MSFSQHEVTQLLLAWNNGDEEAMAQLIPMVERELHRLAQLYLRRERPGHTLQPTALVNEAYLRLIDWKSVKWQNRAHFIGMAARMMRNILVDHAIRRKQLKRGGNLVQISMTAAEKVADEKDVDLIALNDALKDLSKIDPLKAEMVELRFFGGLTVDETAEVLKLSPRRVDRDWKIAKAWLFKELRKRAENG